MPETVKDSELNGPCILSSLVTKARLEGRTCAFGSLAK
jgi:hypothetical protein